MLAQQTKYALRAILFLSENNREQFFRIDEIAAATSAPSPYLSKIMRALTEAGHIEARRGKNGGLRFPNSGKSLSFYEICRVLNDPVVQEECVLFKKACNSNKPCPFHHNWSSTKSKFIEFLKSTKFPVDTKFDFLL